MKRSRCVLLLAAFLLLAVQGRAQQGATSDAANGIAFFKGTFGEALAKAKQENKPLFVDFYAVWCVPCKKMAKTVFTQEEVGKYFNEHFISLQLDAEKGENVEIARNYKVAAYPTVAFIAPDGKALSVNTGAMDKDELMEAAKIVAGERVSFEELYNKYKADNSDLDVQQQLLLKAPSFLQAQEGMEADKWVTRLQKLYKNYIAAKAPLKLINENDYKIILTLEGDEDKEHKQYVIDLINDHLDDWTKAVGKAPSYYIVEANDLFAEDLAKDGNAKYKEYVEKVKNQYAKAYGVVGLKGITPYEKSRLYFDALYNLYKNKDVDGYVKAMQIYFGKMEGNLRSADYGKAAQNLYMAAGKSLKSKDHEVAIQWAEKALAQEDAVMDRVNYMVMIGDSYRELKNYAKAREFYNQAFAETLRLENMEMPQAMLQGAIKQKLSTLELLEK
ncbi:thioredoxin family protein [Prevotella multiformis]|uniref:Thioredoxin n=1 Tax=Prevotella multiformis DSM 16608 TaxID=888743 RepID=F0FAV3_9BACT|nr:thioredoxin family protein [Prevotella multiformis]EGC18716.1 thioredoxin [Prevotella multiformis DSM 16608]